MKTKLTSGAELDFLTRDELRDTLKSWQTELTRGVKLRRRAITGNATAGGVLVMGDDQDGPSEGMAWAITRLSVVPSATTLGANGLQVYANTHESGAGLLIASLKTDVFPGDHGCNLMSGDSLRIAGTGITAGGEVWVTMSIKEVPVQQIWSL